MNPIWTSWAEFCAMGGYGPFVWGAFGVTALVLVVELVTIAARRRAIDRDADAGQTDADDPTGGFQSLPTP